MKVKLALLVNSIQSLQEIMNLNFNAKVAFSLLNLIKKINSELQSFEEIRRNKIMEFSSDKKKVDDDKSEEYAKQLNEVLQQDVELPEFHLKESDFEGLEVKTQQLLNLEWLIK